jgi:hypothetical protein
MSCKTLPEKRPVSEADIQAYTDGSTSHERADYVQQYLAEQPREWQRILFYRRLNAQIRHTFLHTDTDRDAAAVASIAATSSARRFGRWRNSLAIGLAGTVASAAVAAWLAVSSPTQRVVDNAAVMALMEASNDASDSSTAHIAAPPAPFDQSAVGLRVVASGTLDLGPFVKVRRYVYENDEGQKIVLLGARAWFTKGEPQWSARRIGMLRLIGWTAHGVRWVLAGDARTHGLMRAADAATLSRDGSQ